MLCVLSEILMITLRAFRIIEIVDRSAYGAGLLRSFIIKNFVFGKIKLKLTALGADVDLNLKRARKKIRKVAEDPPRFSELYTLAGEILHFFVAFWTGIFVHYNTSQ